LSFVQQDIAGLEFVGQVLLVREMHQLHVGDVDAVLEDVRDAQVWPFLRSSLFGW
jgi:hypothetical protein